MNIRSYANAQLRIFLSFCLFTAFGASFRHRQNFRLTGLSLYCPEKASIASSSRLRFSLQGFRHHHILDLHQPGLISTLIFNPASW